MRPATFRRFHALGDSLGLIRGDSVPDGSALTRITAISVTGGHPDCLDARTRLDGGLGDPARTDVGLVRTLDLAILHPCAQTRTAHPLPAVHVDRREWGSPEREELGRSVGRDQVLAVERLDDVWCRADEAFRDRIA